MCSHLMGDIEAFGKKPDLPDVSIGSVFFAPLTGKADSEFNKVIRLDSAMASGGGPDPYTIISG
ncbi:3'-5' exoribonuclease domain-containing protein [Enterobacter cloacae]|uniref:3'-5' exoribonuclease domain-containing protein n=1 Tax=Enterobacter cloacae TaxID=550 RepID=UPI003D197258